MQRSTIFFVVLALFASVTFAAKFDVNVEIKKEKVKDSLPESELAKGELAEEEYADEEFAEEESTENEKPSPVHKKPVAANGKQQNKPKPGNKKETPEEVNASQNGAAQHTTNKIVKKIEKITSGPPMKGEKPEEPIKYKPDSVDPLFSLPTPAIGSGKKLIS